MNLLEELRERIARLEAASPRRRYHNQAQAAEQLNMSVNKLRQEQRAGRINGVLRGRVWYFTDEQIQEYLQPRPDGEAA